MIQLIRGFKDILPEEIYFWQYIEKTARDLLESFGFSEIRIPIMERTELFKRSIGESTDIVEKEMYTFVDKKGDPTTLRPEATASIVRSYIQHKMYVKSLVKRLYTIGPMFRRERPQKGRYRQFYQIDAEVFGEDSAYVDAQLIIILATLMSRLKVTDVKAHINSLGCFKCRSALKKALKIFLKNCVDELCDDCKRRVERNPLRVLDCKVPSCKKLMLEAPMLLDFLCDDCRVHFKIVRDALESEDISFVIDKGLVRGLDYYTRTTFEIQTRSLGAQSAVAGGGRYDGLVKALGGPSTPAVGFAIGFDRLAEIVSMNNTDHTEKPEIFIAALGEKGIEKAFKWSTALSCEGIRCVMDFSGRSLKSLMKMADRLDALNVIIAGDKELEDGTVIFRNMQTKEQKDIQIDMLVEEVIRMLKI
mmetsp:Transcript_24252/g.11642  ORF Transcript_24252/g.11642 Transcript_24252/m.11642 type:complete len:419 (+) Transcript_24252:94-1350(+)